MNVGDLIQIDNKIGILLSPGLGSIGIIVDVWIINKERWLRVFWGNGSIGSIISHDIKVLSSH